LGKCYLLLGAIYEKGGDSILAEANYRKAKELYGIKSIDGVDLENLFIYKEVVKGTRIIAKEGKTKKKKKFPWLLVAGGVVLVAVTIILLTKKKKETKYTLTVNLGEGIEGTPTAGTFAYVEGTNVNYNYRLQSGYSNLIVTLDGKEAAASGIIAMDRDHTLTAAAIANEVIFVTDTDEIEIPEDSTSTFNVRLSAQPRNDVNVTVSRVSGDNDISVVTGANLTFTTSNWNIYQTVTLQAAEDGDTTNGWAIIRISSTGLPQKDITAIEIDNNSTDNPPVISIVSPTNDQTVNGYVVIQVNALDDIGISRVEFYVDGFLRTTDTSTPYRYNWDTTAYGNATHFIKAIAYDTSNQIDQHEITVTVNN
jgi:hypothetical protein